MFLIDFIYSYSIVSNLYKNIIVLREIENGFRVSDPVLDKPVDCLTEDLKIGQELAKHVLPVRVSMVGPEGFEPPTKRL